MSGKTTGKVWDLELSPPQQIVLLAMADHADHADANIYPSIGLIAWKTGYSDRQVRRIVKELESAGLLVSTERPNGKPTSYKIDFSKGKLKPDYIPTKVRHGVRTKHASKTDVNGHNVIPITGQDVVPVMDIMSYPDKMSPLTSHGNEETPGYDIASLKKTTNVKDQPLKEIKEKSISHTTPKLEYGFKVDFTLVEKGGGLLQYVDGETIIDRPKFAQEALKIFNAYLETMRQLGRASLRQDERQWTKHQEAALNLALARTDAELIQRYIVDQYQGNDDFWRKLGAPMKLQHIAEHLPAWTQSRTAQPAARTVFRASDELRQALEDTNDTPLIRKIHGIGERHATIDDQAARNQPRGKGLLGFDPPPAAGEPSAV